MTYEELFAAVKSGDVLAVGGTSTFSKIIKWTTKSAVSHVAVVMVEGIGTARTVSVLESTISLSKSGVRKISLRQFYDIESHDGADLWWLPVRDLFNGVAIAQTCEALEGRPYDLLSCIDAIALKSGDEDPSALFCSELVATGLKSGGALPESAISEELTPADICMLDIYSDCRQVFGDQNRMPRHNRVDPNDWANGAQSVQYAYVPPAFTLA